MALIELGIDFGSTHTTIFRLHKGIVLREPSKVLCEKINDSFDIKEIGQKALRSIGKCPPQMMVISPILEGEVVDVEMASVMLREFVKNVITDAPKSKIKAIFSVPCGATLQNRKDLQKVAYNAGISTIKFIPTPIADAVGIGLNITDDNSFALLDIGGGSTDIAVIGANSILNGITLNIGGIHIDIAIMNQVLSKYGMQISLSSAQYLKEEIANLQTNSNASMLINGIDSKTKEIKNIRVSSFDIFDAVKEHYQLLVDAVQGVLTSCSSEIMAQVYRVGIIITGDGSKISGLKEYMSKRLNMRVVIDDQNCSNALGLGSIFGNKSFLKTILKEN